MSNRLDQDREKELTPKRFFYAKLVLEKIGISPHYEDQTKLKFMFGGNEITLFPYSGWHTGKGIKDGRGIDKLLKQLKK